MDAKLEHLKPLEAALRLGAKLCIAEDRLGWDLLAEVGDEIVRIGYAWTDKVMAQQPRFSGKYVRFEGAGVFKGADLRGDTVESIARAIEGFLVGSLNYMPGKFPRILLDEIGYLTRPSVGRTR